MDEFAVLTDLGWRIWLADDSDHAAEQSWDAFPDELILKVVRLLSADDYV